jgi:hypothetical protein
MTQFDLLDENVLYYPSIEFNNPSWVKAALCIWEKIYRIVPSSITPNDDAEIRIAVEEGLIRNVPIEEGDLSNTSEEFFNFIASLPWLPNGLEGSEDDLINLHKDKVDYTLYPILKELAQKINGDWIVLNSRLANGYMFFLANSISKRRRLPKITDRQDVFSIMPYFEQEGNFDEYVSASGREQYYSSIIFPTFIPGGVTRVNIDQILQFRKETGELRRNFRQAVEEFAVNLLKIDSKDYAQELSNSLRKKLESNKKGILETAKLYAKDFIPSFLTIGLPTAISTLGLLGSDGNPFQMKKIIDSVCVGAISAMANSNSRIWSPQMASYYLKLNRKFYDGESFNLEIPRFDRIFEEFIND